MRNSEAAAVPPTVDDSAGTTPASDEYRFDRNRQGAIAGRGFHYQDAASAWLAARMLSDATYESVVPEGTHEDLDCEGSTPVAFQMKSQLRPAGGIRASTIARHVRDLHRHRTERGYTHPCALVLEHDCAEAPIPDRDRLLGAFPDDHPLRVAAARVLAGESLPADAFDDLRVLVVGFDEARRRCAAIVADYFNLPEPVAEHVALRFARMVSDAVDHNAGATIDERRRIDRTALVAMANRTIAETDPSKLTAALDTGACEPARLDTPTDDERYFEGLHAQPGHVAAGLPAWRLEIVAEVQAGLGVSLVTDPAEELAAKTDTKGAAARSSGGGVVLLTGPSGVGKSTLMWMAAAATRAVTWFRVHRLNLEDVDDLCRLAEGSRPDATRPVGFLVDGVGLADVAGWDALVRRVTAFPDVCLIGTARHEDTFQISTLTSTVRIDVGLDEPVAELIHKHLKEGGHTREAHWREAYDQANGLTLEYTHYLTQGRRLTDVLKAQVGRLVAEGADTELRLLALASTAQMHAIEVPVRCAREALGLNDSQMRRAVARLKDEHFLVEDSGFLAGIHQQRSTALSAAAHSSPPPSMPETIASLMEHLPEADLSRLVVGVLQVRDDIDRVVLTGAVKRCEGGNPPEVFVGMLHALRSVDFLRHARSWAKIIRDEAVPPAQWPITVWWGLMNTDLLESMNPSILRAVPRLREVGRGNAPLRDAFVESIGSETLTRLILESETGQRLVTLLTGCDAAQTVIEALSGADWSTTPASLLLASCGSSEFATIAGVGQWLDPAVAARMVEAAGGESAVLDRIRLQHPLAYGLARIPEGDAEPAQGNHADQASYKDTDSTSMSGDSMGGDSAEDDLTDLLPTPAGDVAYARCVWIDDELTPDPNTQAVDLAHTMLRSLPGTVRADISTLRAIDTPYRIGNLTFGSSGLLAPYSVTSLEQLWNKVRAALVLNELGFPTQGQHASEIAALLPRTQRYLQNALTLWLVDRDVADEWDRAGLLAEAIALRTQVDQLTTPQNGAELLQQTIPSIVDLIEDLTLNDPTESRPATIDDSAAVTPASRSDALDGIDNAHAHSVIFKIARSVTNALAGNDLGLLPAQMENLLEDLTKTRTDERWDLAGLSKPPPELDTIRSLLVALADIAAAVHHGAISVSAVRHEARSGAHDQAIQRSAEACARAIATTTRQFIDGLQSRLNAASKVPVRVIADLTPTTTNYWPPVDFAVIVECRDIMDWINAHEPLLTILNAVREARHLPPTLVCPSINGVDEPALALRLIRTVFPGTDAYYERFPDRPRPDPDGFDLVSDLQRAFDGLHRRSSLNYAATKIELGETLRRTYDELPTLIAEALDRIRGYGEDACIDAILTDLNLCIDVVDEETEPGGTPGAFAGEFLDGAFQERESQVQATRFLLTLAAVQWRHDPATAVRLIED